MTSDLVLKTRELHRDVFLFKQKGLGSPYRMNEVGEVVRLNDKKVIWASSRQNCLRGLGNNTGADQPAHPRSLISTFVIHFFGKFHM